MNVRTPVTLALAAAALFGCTERPDEGDLFTTVQMIAVETSGASVDQAATTMIEAAEDYCWLAAETFTSTDVADALVSAQERGIEIRVVGDTDRRTEPGFLRLAERLQPVDGQLPTRFGDGPLTYNPQLVDTIDRAGDHNRMTHNFVVCDDREVLTTTGGFGAMPGVQIAARVSSHYMGRDYADEFNQLYGGTYASTLSSYNGPLKSITDNREWYDGDVGRVEVYFGPQERPVKRIVDAIYAARASVSVVTEELTSGPVADALRYKAEAGFDVTVVVSTAGRDAGSSRYAALEAAFSGLANARIGTAQDIAMNAVVIDDGTSPIDGRRHQSSAWLFSAPVLAATSIVEGQTSTARASDAFSDSNLMVFNREVGQANPAYDAFVDTVDLFLGDAQ